MEPASYCTVQDLTPGSTGHNIVLRVHAVEVVVERKSSVGGGGRGVEGGEYGARRAGGGRVLRIAEVVAGDATGAVVLSLRDEQIAMAVPGEALVLRNARVDMFRGFMRLRVDKWGKITAHPDGIASKPPAPTEVNLVKNVSLAQYEFVPDASN